MTAVYRLAAAVPLLVSAALAQPPQSQDDLAFRKMKAEMENMVVQSKVIGLKGAVMGPVVKSAPYSAVEISESNQTLADGTRIHNETQMQVYRDSEGRMRRETPEQVTIMDPVAGTTWFLNPKTQTAHKVPLGTMGPKTFAFTKSGGAGGEVSGSYVEMRTVNRDGVTSVMVNGKPVDPATADAMKAAHEKMAMDGMDPTMAGPVAIMRSLPPGAFPTSDNVVFKSEARMAPANSESLGKQALEGVESEGTRTTSTLAAGTIGNDRPIQTVMERWYSPELQTVMMTRHSDPRSGEETFRLTNVNRNEPAAYLFQVPASYQIQDRE